MAATDTERIRVLHVDDEPELGALASTFLERTDGRLRTEFEAGASTALDRLRAAEDDGEAAFDCVVSDYEMPGMDGQGFLEAVRTEWPTLPFILFTGKGSEEVASEAISAGVTDYLRKGVGTDQYKLLAHQIVNAVERARAEARLTRKQEQADVLLADSPVMVTVSVDGECAYINDAGVALLGAEGPEEILGTRYLDLVSPAGDAEAEAIFLSKHGGERTGDATGTPEDRGWGTGVSNIERQLTTVGGETRTVEVTARRIEYEGQDAVLAIVNDVTERKRREERLRDREGRYRALAENFPHGMVFLFDADARYTIAKGEGLRTVGLDSDDVEGKTVAEALPDPLREEFEPRCRRALAGEEDVFELEVDGHVFRVHTIPIRDRDGTVVAGIHIAPEITEERAEARELRRQNDRLQEFASVISHDLRNPLTVARGHLDIARGDADSEELAIVEDSLQHMEILIEDVLSLARSGLIIDVLDPVSLHSVAADAWEQVSPRGTRLDVETDCTLQADASRLRELLGNLFRNTVEHGGDDRSIRVGALGDGFYVEDDGVGIPVVDREQVFETGHSSIDDGTGLGLAIVRQIAEAHGWRIEAIETDGGGTRFEVRGVTFADVEE